MFQVSLYIPCYNAAKFLGRCIEGVRRQTYPVAELFIVDDGSTDSTAAVASSCGVRIVKHDRNRGLAAARNTALRSARNELVASLDADCVPEPEWLGTLVQRLEDPEIVAAGGRLRETALDTIADRWRKAHMTQDWGEELLTNPPCMFGNNILLRKSIAVRVGGYDEELRTNGEDVDLSNRLRRNGFKTIYTPRAVVNHLRRDTVPSIFDTFWRYWRFSSRSYFGGVRVRQLLYNLSYAHPTSFLVLVWRDLRRGNFSLLMLDVLVPVYMATRDLKMFWSDLGHRASSVFR